MFPIDLDPPLQAKFRRVLNRRFTPEAVAEKRGEIQTAIDSLIDDFIETGSADLASQLVRPLLPRIVLPLLGVPSEARQQRSEEHTSELQSLMRISYAVFCLKK